MTRHRSEMEGNMRNFDMKKFSTILIFLLALSTVSIPISSAAVACPDTWNFQPTLGEISLLSNGVVPSNFSENNPTPLSNIQNEMKLGQSFLVLKNFNSPLPGAYFQKISEGGRDIQVTGQWKRSIDGKIWLGFAGIRGDLQPINSPLVYQDGERRNVKTDRVFSTVDSSRMGMIPNAKVAYEIKVDVKGCKQKIFYENQAPVPAYSIKSTSLDTLVEAYYNTTPTAKRWNFVSQASCNETMNSLISHIKEVSKQGQVWTIKNTKRGVLDLGWSLTESENMICARGGDLPGFDLQLTPSLGDNCISLTTALSNVYTYKTVKSPCSVSLDLKVGEGAFEISKIEIVSPSLTSPNQSKVKTINCMKGSQVKKITGINPKCPKGYKTK